MPTESGKPLIVISYAHADAPENPAEGEVKWLSFVTGYLRPAIKHGAVDLWLDRLMPGGADWEPEIEQKFRTCDVFLLLVSRHSLASDYVVGCPFLSTGADADAEKAADEIAEIAKNIAERSNAPVSAGTSASDVPNPDAADA